MTETKPKRCWFRFSLRTLLVLVTVLCVWLGLKVNAARRQHEAVQTILRADGRVAYDWQLVPMAGKPDEVSINPNLSPSGPTWLRERIGDEFFGDVISVSLYIRPISPSDFQQLSKLHSLMSLDLSGTKIVPNAVQRPIQDADLSVLKQMSQLRSLILRDADIDGSGLASLSIVKRLKRLELSHTHVDDAAMKQIGEMTALTNLSIDGTRITDTGLRHLQNLTSLEVLDIGSNAITDAGLKYLRYLTKLGFLRRDGTHVTAEGVRELQKSLPNCTISDP